MIHVQAYLLYEASRVTSLSHLQSSAWTDYIDDIIMKLI